VYVLRKSIYHQIHLEFWVRFPNERTQRPAEAEQRSACEENGVRAGGTGLLSIWPRGGGGGGGRGGGGGGGGGTRTGVTWWSTVRNNLSLFLPHSNARLVAAEWSR